MAAACWRRTSTGIELHVRLTPKSGRDELAGTVVQADGSVWLAARVTAPPEGGKANKALMRLVARRLGVSQGAVALVQGAQARMKRLAVIGPADELGVQIEAIVAGAAHG